MPAGPLKSSSRQFPTPPAPVMPEHLRQALWLAYLQLVPSSASSAGLSCSLAVMCGPPGHDKGIDTRRFRGSDDSATSTGS